jgi:predicted transcriptional regulator
MNTNLARRTDPQTSHDAAQLSLEFSAKHEAKIFGAICDAAAYGATAKEIARVTNLSDVQVNRRLGNMGARGLIVRNRDEHREGCCVWRKA